MTPSLARVSYSEGALHLAATALAYHRANNPYWAEQSEGTGGIGFFIDPRPDGGNLYLPPGQPDFSEISNSSIGGVGVYNVGEDRYLGVTNQENGVGSDNEAFDRYIRRNRRLSDGATKRLVDVEVFIKQQAGLQAYVYIQESTHLAWVFFRDMATLGGDNYKALNIVAACLPRLVPWFFECKPLEPEEQEMLRCLLEGTPDRFVEKAEEILGGLNGKFDSIAVRKNLVEFSGYTNTALSAKSLALDSQVVTYVQEVQRLKEGLKNAYTNLDHCTVERECIEKALRDSNNGAGKDRELAEYFNANKALELLAVRPDNSLVFSVRTPLKNFDCDIFDSYLDNECSLLYDCNYDSAGISTEAAMRLLGAIFNDEVELIMHGKFRFRAEDGWGYELTQFSDGQENPHLSHFNCFGDYGAELHSACCKGDLISFAEMCIASVGSLNIGEAPTMEHFLRDLFFEYPNLEEEYDRDDEDDENLQEPCCDRKIRFPEDGDELYTVSEAIRKLQEKDNRAAQG